MSCVSFGSKDRMVQCRHSQSVIALDIETLPSVGHGPNQNRFPRSIIIARIGFGRFSMEIAFQGNEVEGGRGEMAYLTLFLMSHVSGHRESFQINFRPHDGRAEIQ